MGKSKFETRVQEIKRMNGQIVLQILRKNVHATADEIINHVAGVAQINPDIIKPDVKKILNEGVDNGFLFKSGFKYTIDPPEPEGRMMTDDENSDKTYTEPSHRTPVNETSKSPPRRRKPNFKYV